MGVRPSTIDVRIGELVLLGVSPADAPHIGAATERELARLLAERGVPPGLTDGAALDTLDGGTFPRRPRATPGAIGGGIARAVYRGLGQ